MSTAADKSQLGMTDSTHEAAEEVVERGGFGILQDVYRLAIAVALIKNLDPAPESVSGRKTYIGVGSLDPEGMIRTAIRLCHDDGRDRPYAFAERLAEPGIADLHEHLNGGRSIREYLHDLIDTGQG